MFNFLVIGGLLISVDSLGFMGELPAIPVEDHHVKRKYTNHASHLISAQGNITGYNMNMTLAPVEIFTFSSIISAVDPVAVLAM